MSGSEQAAVPESRFRYIAELGEGGMAKVHLAVARGPSGFNKLVVLKTLRASLASDASLVEMLMQEARLAARLNHPNVVQTYEVTEDDGLPVIVMEYLEGQPLSQIVARAKGVGARFPLMMHLTALCDVLAGLHHAHELSDFDGSKLNLVHRDVSPDNVFVTYEGQVKLLDFGIAKVATVAPGATGTGVVKGKVRYMAPEQMEGVDIDRRADVFAVGVMLWEALANERIWLGMSDVAVMTRVMGGDIPSPRTINPDVSESLERICMKAMSDSRSNRYETAKDFQLALEAAMADLGTAVRARDLGNWVESQFSDTRARIRMIIEEEISRNGEPSPSGRTKVRVISMAKLGTTPSGQNTPARADADLPGERARGRLAWLVLASLALLVSLGLVAWVSAARGSRAAANATSPSAIAPASAALSASSTPAQAVQTVEIDVNADPAQASLFFDDEPLATNPATLVRPKDGTKHWLRATAAGFTTKSLAVSLDRDSKVSIELERQVAQATQATATAPGRSDRPVHTAGPARTAASAPSKPNCSVPYYFDAQGIKKIRAECL